MKYKKENFNLILAEQMSASRVPEAASSLRACNGQFEDLMPLSKTLTMYQLPTSLAEFLDARAIA